MLATLYTVDQSGTIEGLEINPTWWFIVVQIRHEVVLNMVVLEVYRNSGQI